MSKSPSSPANDASESASSEAAPPPPNGRGDGAIATAPAADVPAGQYHIEQSDRIDDDRTNADIFETAISEEEQITVEIRNYRRDGTPFWNELTVAPVYDTDGDVTHYVGFQNDVTDRKRAEQLAEEPEKAPGGPSSTAARVLRHMNGRPTATTTKIRERVPEALRRVEERAYPVSVDTARKALAQQAETIRQYQRRFHRSVLQSIRLQHKPFYRFSRKGWTDRIFPANHSVLSLPSDLRTTLCQDYHEIDLKSAHLMIAAWLWGAEKAKRKLRRPDYCIWADLRNHFLSLPNVSINARPGACLSDSGRKRIKKALKKALYSLVYGMSRQGVLGGLTTDLKPLFRGWTGLSPGKHFARHDMIESLFQARGEQFQKIQNKDGMHAAGGRWVRLAPRIRVAKEEDRTDPVRAASAKVLATVAQSYEMELMSVVVGYEQDREERAARNYFRIAFWLHDGVYVSARSICARMKDLDQRLKEKAEELGVFARFEHEPVTPPE